MNLVRALRPILCASSLGLALLACTGTVPQPVEINVAVINDLHGYLHETEQPYRQPSAADGTVTIRAGGIEILGGVIERLRRQDEQLLLVGGGDLIGASPPMSAIWADEPTIYALDALGMRLSTLGNHELDYGRDELMRMINGGCQSSRPDQACRLRETYPGAGFTYLAANLLDQRSGKPLVSPYQIVEAHGQKVAFVGAVLRDVGSVVSKSAMAGLTVTDEAEAINALIPQMRREGAVAIIALIHQGGRTDEAYDQANCSRLQGPIVELAKRLDPAVDVIASAHTHQAYRCLVDGRPVFQGGSYGQFVSHVRLSIDPRAQRVASVEVDNLQVDPQRYAASAPLSALRKEVEARSDERLSRPVARLGAKLVGRKVNAAGESTLGNLVADAQLAALRDRGAQIALINNGGLRSDFRLAPGQVQLTYGQLAGVLPFRNELTLLSLEGGQLRQLLESQWRADGSTRVLQVSAGFTYQWDSRRPLGERIVPGSLRLNGLPLRDTDRVKVVVNDFMAGGGDGFAGFTQAAQREDSGVLDVDALEQHLLMQDQAGTPAGRAAPAGRIQRL